MLLYEPFLNITLGPSCSGKTYLWLRQLSKLKYINGQRPKRVIIISNAGDTQFSHVSDEHKERIDVQTGTYQSFDYEWESGTFYIFDELSQALLMDPAILKDLIMAFTTHAHHKRFSIVCLMQQLYGTGAVSLLRLAHCVTLQMQQGYNSEIMRHFPVFRRVTKKFEAFLLRHQKSAPTFGTFYFNVPQFVSPLVNVACIHIEPSCDLIINMNDGANVIDIFEPLKSLLAKYLTEDSLLIIPSAQVTLAASDEIENKGAGSSSSPTGNEVGLEEAVNRMIASTVSVKNQRKYFSLWYFIRGEAAFTIFPQNLMLEFEGHKIGLYELINLLLRPSHLHKREKRTNALPSHSQAAVHFLARMIKSPGFPVSVIKNKHLLVQAQKNLSN